MGAKISLSKGHKISLEKEAPGVKRFTLGLGWGKKKTGFFGSKSVDLDASCLMAEGNKVVETVYFGKLESRDGSIIHSGDDLVGGGRAGTPNEKINVDLSKVPANIDNLVFTINSFSNDTFEGIPNAFCVLENAETNDEVARFDLSEDGGSHTAFVTSKLYKHNGEWKFAAMGHWGHGKTASELRPLVERNL